MILGCLFIVIFLGGIIFYAAVRPSGKNSVAIETPKLGATNYIEHNANYDIAVNYASSTPLLSSVGSSANENAVAVMKKFVSDTVVQFKTDLGLGGVQSDKKKSLQITYLIGSSYHTVSYIFTIYENTGGAHNNMFFRTFTFNTSTGTSLALSDIFVQGDSYLNALSTISRAELPDVIGSGADTSFINKGTTPEDLNFQNFFFDNQYLVILFPPYQVGSYAAGPQTLRIPLSKLSNILKPEYK